jgi:hypothetical protein
MSFRVQPAKMRTAATELGGNADDVAAFLAYANRYSTIAEQGMGRFADVMRTHEKFFAALTGSLTHLRTVLNDSEIALQQAASYYEQTDAEVAANVDATLPEAPRPSLHDSQQPSPGGPNDYPPR